MDKKNFKDVKIGDSIRLFEIYKFEVLRSNDRSDSKIEGIFTDRYSISHVVKVIKNYI